MSSSVPVPMIGAVGPDDPNDATATRARKAQPEQDAAAREEPSRALAAATDERTAPKEAAIEQAPEYTIYFPDGRTIRVSRLVLDALQAGGVIYSDHGTLRFYVPVPSPATASDDRKNRARTRSPKWISSLLAFWPKWR
jgi:hypothetical protein